MTKIESPRVNGLECVYADRGPGPAVLFVHGSVADCRIWDEHAEIIGSHYRVLAPSQRYFGVSPWPDGGRSYSVLTHATDLAAFVRALGLPPVTLVGWSYGGAVCLAMSCANPDLVGRLFLYEPSLATFVTDPSAAQRASDDRLEMLHASKLAAGQGDLGAAVEQFIDDVNGRAGTFRALPDKVQQMMRENARTLPLLFSAPPPPQITCADLGRLSMPATVARGSDSRACFRIAAEGAARCMAAARTATVPNARHLWPIEDPRRFSQLVLDWLGAG